MEDCSQYLVRRNATIKEALIILNALSHDILVLFVIDDKEQMVGTLTDGDIRRYLVTGGELIDCVINAMNKQFHFVRGGNALSVIKECREKSISLLPYLDKDNKVIKIINLRVKRTVLPVDAVLMAGGKGERLRPLTQTTPKPLLKVGEKAIIDYNIDCLISYGIEHISVTVNYLHEQIENHFKEVKNSVYVKCVCEPQFLGTIGSIRFVESFAHDTVLLMNSDLFTNINYEDFYLYFKEHDADLAVAAVPYSISIPYGIFELDGRNVEGVREKPTYNYYANGGIYLIKREMLEMIPANVVFNATDFIEMLIEQGKKIVRFPITGYWIDIGNHEDFKRAQELVKHL